jgi:hypothetical protein
MGAFLRTFPGALFILTLVAGGAAQTRGPYRASSNFAADLAGMPDMREGCWGTAEVAQWRVTFSPPAGYRVRILEIHGDLVSWIKSMPKDPATPAESAAGVLLGLQSTPAPGTSGRCDVCSDVVSRVRVWSGTPETVGVLGTTLLYIQDVVTQSTPRSRAAFDLTQVNEFLQADNKLLVTVASWLNTTGKPIHAEPTFTLTYQFEEKAQ